MMHTTSTLYDYAGKMPVLSSRSHDFYNYPTLARCQNHPFANQLGKGMKILTRLTELSVDDLQELQAAILNEIQHRKELTAIKIAKRTVSGGQKSRKNRQSGPVSIPMPTPANPAVPRRAA